MIASLWSLLASDSVCQSFSWGSGRVSGHELSHDLAWWSTVYLAEASLPAEELEEAL